jgi:hypothetical protein
MAQSSAPPPDSTPAGGTTRGKPAKGLTQEWKPAFTVVVVLIAIGVLVGTVLWTSLEFGGGDPDPPATVPGASTANPDETETVAAEAPGSTPAVIATITAYDPDGDGTENDGDAVLSAADGDPGTTWATVCYSSQYMGGKRGVGLVVSFDEPARTAVSVEVATGPYQVVFHATDAEQIPATIDTWGPELGATQFADEPGTVVSPVPSSPARHVLVLLKEIGPDPTCTEANPYRGRLGEIAPVG